ncbi:MAG: type II toxin-antitoxin system HicB family antitoxin [Chloroflexi bacterium]|nr:type II toxin-antitoxin system HicB family antitoxin [Chloroflexota bacterium]
MVVKINVCMPREVLDKIDKASEAAHASRSAFLVRAVEHYLEEQEKERQRLKRAEAAKTIKEIAAKLGDWDAVGELLRSRNSH